MVVVNFRVIFIFFEWRDLYNDIRNVVYFKFRMYFIIKKKIIFKIVIYWFMYFLNIYDDNNLLVINK